MPTAADFAAADSAVAGARVAFVLWSGNLGGAQMLTAELAAVLRRHQVDARIVFVCESDGLGRRLAELEVPFEALWLPRGRDVVRHPRRFARLVRSAGADCAILVSSGYLAGALRAGGYRRPIAAVEHGGLLQVDKQPPSQRLLRRIDRASGLWACAAEVAVSNYALEELRSRRHGKRLICIRNGIDLARFVPDQGENHPNRPFSLGYAGRLVASKGVSDVIRAFAATTFRQASLLLIAGDGPERCALERLARDLQVTSRIRFLGRIDDVPSFWRMCDVGVAPSGGSIESFCLAAVEAMACGLPVVASRSGALPETVDEGVTGLLVDQGNIVQLAQAFERYAHDAPLRDEHGRAARRLCEQQYDLGNTARGYMNLIDELVKRWGQRGSVVRPLKLSDVDS
jgi:glycosyltransferase involved in cell wall biosynthesis